MNTIPSTEDRVWAVISHLSSLLLGMGIALPIIGWADQRRKSKYATFQCLQALVYQSLGYTIWLLSFVVILILWTFVALVTTESNGGNRNAISTGVMVIFFIMVLGFLSIYFILPIIAAIACALGKDYRYPLVGDRLSRYLGYDRIQESDEGPWLMEDHETRWVAAAGHFSILILFWGMLAPLTAWILYGKHNGFLKFQSMQTFIYQALINILSITAIVIYVAGLLLMVISMGGMGIWEASSAFTIIGAAIMVLAMLIILLIPFLHIVGQWAGYRVLGGDNYHYPLVGRLVEKFTSKE